MKKNMIFLTICILNIVIYIFIVHTTATTMNRDTLISYSSYCTFEPIIFFVISFIFKKLMKIKLKYFIINTIILFLLFFLSAGFWASRF